ncbi:MAG: GyrI-like domain-containing protein [Chitinophagaceae bacterium]|nr:GyrI-like domain-containing protein [Chitinophagaceae bacterium]
MKKVLAVILILVVLAIVLIYSLIPARILIVNIAFVKSNASAVQRTVSRNDLWDKWGHGQFTVDKRLSNGVSVNSSYKGTGLPGQIIIISLRDDSSAIRWETSLPVATGPLQRFSSYMHARSLKEKMTVALQYFKNFCDKDSNVYGLHIQQRSTRDTFLVATKFSTRNYPSLSIIYDNINKLRKFAVENNAAETSSPMLNITKEDSSHYNCMVAVPVNQQVTNKGDIFFVRMVPGRFLVTELKGGPLTISQAHQTMRQYFQDYKRTSMAIPFEYLVTDRQFDKDTANWVTRLYYPVY